MEIDDKVTGNPMPSPDKLPEFRRELEHLINRHSMENESNTPDFILADYLIDCLRAFDRAANLRTKWYGKSE